MNQVDLHEPGVRGRDHIKATSLLYVIPFVLIGLGILLSVTIFLIPIGIPLLILGIVSAIAVAVFDRTPDTETEANRIGTPSP